MGVQVLKGNSLQGMKVLLLGAGDLGCRLGQAILAQGARVIAVKRNPWRLPPGFEGYAADYTVPGELDFIQDLAPDYAVLTLKPLSMDDAGYRRGFVDATRNFLAGCGNHRARGILAVSSTRVYAENQGGWVNEDSALVSEGGPALALVEAENALRASGQPVSIVRCSGIYGEPHGRLLARIAAGRLCPPEPRRYSNRVHREDVSAFLQWGLEQWQAGVEPAPTYLLSDGEPAPQYAVEKWLAEGLGVIAGAEQAALRGAAHRRCDSTRVQRSGFEFRYPDFRTGYAAVLAARAATTRE